MIIKRLGLSCFMIKAHETVLVLDPFNPKEVGLPLAPVEADMVLYSKPLSEIEEHATSRVQVSSNRASLGKEMLVISEPGEYEVGGIMIQVHTDPSVVVMNIENVNICYIGMGKKLSAEVDFESLPTIDYLIVPVGDSALCLDWKILEVVLREMEAGVVIPSGYHEDGMKSPYDKLKTLNEFAAEFGAGDVRHEKKLKLQNVILGEEETYSVVALDSN
jgi:hypothetical protein